MKPHASSSANTNRYMHEVFFSLNLGLALMAVFFSVAPSYPSLSDFCTIVLHRMDIAISKYLHLLPPQPLHPKDTITGGYFEFFIPGVGLALCLWGPLRLFRRTRLARETLRSVAGVAAVAAVPLAWVWRECLAAHRWWWTPFVTVQVYEVAAALCCVIEYLYGKWPISAWGSVLLLLVHYAFWLWQFRFSFWALDRGWGGSDAITPVVGLFAGLTWAIYVWQKQPPTLRSAPFHSV